MSRAFAWAADDAGCGFYRSRLVAAALRERGHDVGQGIVLDAAYDDAPAILAQRTCNPGPTANLARWRARGGRVVLDLDDDLFGVDATNNPPDVADFFGHPGTRARLEGNAFASDLVTCVSPELARRLAPTGAETMVIDNGLPGVVLNWPNPITRSESPNAEAHAKGCASRRKRGWRPVVGLVATANTVHDVLAVPEAVAAVESVRRRQVARVHIVGLPERRVDQLALGRRGVRVTHWAPAGFGYLDAIDFDVWVAPYRDNAYNRAKGATKALEAAFRGAVIIASRVGPYADAVEHGVTGYLVDDPADWSHYLEELVGNDWLRWSMARHAWRKAAAEWTIEQRAADWERALFPEGP